MQLFLEAVPIILKLFSKARGHPLLPCAHMRARGKAIGFVCRLSLARKSPDLDFYASEQLLSITNRSISAKKIA